MKVCGYDVRCSPGLCGSSRDVRINISCVKNHSSFLVFKNAPFCRTAGPLTPLPNNRAQHNKELAAKQEQLALMLWWLYGGVVINVLRTFFYITDSQPLKSAAVYYRKPVWRSMESEAINNLTSSMLQVSFFFFRLVLLGRALLSSTSCCTNFA